MEGAYRAMRDGYVDEEWAKEHHALWYQEVKDGKRPEKLQGQFLPEDRHDERNSGDRRNPQPAFHDRPERAGQVTPVHVYTSGDEGELFLNGKSLGRKKKGQYEYRLRWDDAVYQPGTLNVVTYKNGRRWATDEVRTAGDAAMLAAKADRSTIDADGQDLSFVTVTVEDAKGVMAPRADIPIHFDISGPGEIAATDNGDPTSYESFQSLDHKAFKGLCLVIVRSTKGAGPIVLQASAPGLRSASVTIQARTPSH